MGQGKIKYLFTIYIVIVLSFSAYAADWGLRVNKVNVMKAPSAKSKIICTISKDQYVGIKDISRSRDWLKIGFSTYLPYKEFKKLHSREAEIQLIGYEGTMAQVKIKGWVKRKYLIKK